MQQLGLYEQLITEVLASQLNRQRFYVGERTLDAAEAQSAAALTDERFADAMAALATLRGPLDAFFDKVVVNADNPAIRLNRLALLNRVRAAMAAFAFAVRLKTGTEKFSPSVQFGKSPPRIW